MFVVVKDDVGRGRLYPELAEHADDLAPVQRAVIHHVHHDLPGGKAGVTHEAGFEGHLPGNVGVVGCLGPGFPLSLQARPFLNDEIEEGKGIVGWDGIAGIGDARIPDGVGEIRSQVPVETLRRRR